MPGDPNKLGGAVELPEEVTPAPTRPAPVRPAPVRPAPVRPEPVPLEPPAALGSPDPLILAMALLRSRERLIAEFGSALDDTPAGVALSVLDGEEQKLLGAEVEGAVLDHLDGEAAYASTSVAARRFLQVPPMPDLTTIATAHQAALTDIASGANVFLAQRLSAFQTAVLPTGVPRREIPSDFGLSGPLAVWAGDVAGVVTELHRLTPENKESRPAKEKLLVARAGSPRRDQLVAAMVDEYIREANGIVDAIRAERAKAAEEARVAEEARKAAAARAAEAERLAEEARVAEAARKAEEARVAEAARQAEAARAHEILQAFNALTAGLNRLANFLQNSGGNDVVDRERLAEFFRIGEIDRFDRAVNPDAQFSMGIRPTAAKLDAFHDADLTLLGMRQAHAPDSLIRDQEIVARFKLWLLLSDFLGKCVHAAPDDLRTVLSDRQKYVLGSLLPVDERGWQIVRGQIDLDRLRILEARLEAVIAQLELAASRPTAVPLTITSAPTEPGGASPRTAPTGKAQTSEEPATAVVVDATTSEGPATSERPATSVVVDTTTLSGMLRSLKGFLMEAMASPSMLWSLQEPLMKEMASPRGFALAVGAGACVCWLFLERAYVTYHRYGDDTAASIPVVPSVPAVTSAAPAPAAAPTSVAKPSVPEIQWVSCPDATAPLLRAPYTAPDDSVLCGAATLLVNDEPGHLLSIQCAGSAWNGAELSGFTTSPTFNADSTTIADGGADLARFKAPKEVCQQGDGVYALAIKAAQ